MNSTHRANVVRIGEILPHPNADKLEITMVGGYQVVIGKGSFKTGDLAVYIQPDSVVPQTAPFKFLWADYLKRPEMCQHTNDGKSSVIEHNGTSMCLRCSATIIDGETVLPEKRRRITVKRLRKECSEGLLMPIADLTCQFTKLPWRGVGLAGIGEGTDVAAILGITHYDPVEVDGVKMGMLSSAPRRRYPKTLKGWFFFLIHKIGFKKFGIQMTESVSLDVPTYDVDNIKNHMNAFRPDELVVVTEKIHGSNARFLYTDGHMYAGSHYQWKHEKSPCAFRKVLEQQTWIEEWCRANEGSTLYGEVVPTQKDFAYGCKSGELKLFAFDIRRPDGTWQKPWSIGVWNHADMLVVPKLYEGPFDLVKIKPVIDGPSRVDGAKNIREGGVISPVVERRVPGLGRLQLKLVSNSYLEKSN